VKAHEADLRVEVAKHLRAEARPAPHEDAGAGAGGSDGSDDDVVRRAAAFAADVAAQGSEAAPDPRLRGLLQYAERLALAPSRVDASHVELLRELGFDDRAIHDAAQVVSYFSYINRVADGLGVDLEPEMETSTRSRSH